MHLNAEVIPVGFWDNGMPFTVLSFPTLSPEKIIDPGKHASGRPWRVHQRPHVLLGSLRKETSPSSRDLEWKTKVCLSSILGNFMSGPSGWSLGTSGGRAAEICLLPVFLRTAAGKPSWSPVEGSSTYDQSLHLGNGSGLSEKESRVASSPNRSRRVGGYSLPSLSPRGNSYAFRHQLTCHSRREYGMSRYTVNGTHNHD